MQNRSSLLKSNGFKLSDCLAAAAEIEADLQRLACGLTEAQFHAPSRRGGWSVGFCLEHLILTGQAFLPQWDAALQKAPVRCSGCDRHYPYNWYERMFLQSVEPPYAIRTKSAHFATPSSRRPLADTIRRFLAMHRELTHRIELAATRNPARTKVQSPFASWLRYPLGFSFDLALAHERRHLWQAWQVRRQYAEIDPT